LEVSTSLLVRHRETISQVGLSRDERIENMRDAFRVIDRQRIKGRAVILVDDVMTTGTTLSECAQVLKSAGAERVWAATAARAFQGDDLREPADGSHEEEVEAVEVGASV
jgi:predicted amidophosphoribosyltransferase